MIFEIVTNNEIILIKRLCLNYNNKVLPKPRLFEATVSNNLKN
jgi:hypothetical protein